MSVLKLTNVGALLSIIFTVMDLLVGIVDDWLFFASIKIRSKVSVFPPQSVYILIEPEHVNELFADIFQLLQ